MKGQRIARLLVLGLVLTACAQNEKTTRADAERGAEVFAANCVACHGQDARGNGPQAASLGTAPPNLREIAKRNDGTFPFVDVASTIDGYTRGEKAAAMPEFGAGDLGPLIQVEHEGVSTPIPADLLALTLYLESIQD